MQHGFFTKIFAICDHRFFGCDHNWSQTTLLLTRINRTAEGMKGFEAKALRLYFSKAKETPWRAV
jgi:hypothetical protein